MAAVCGMSRTLLAVTLIMSSIVIHSSSLTPHSSLMTITADNSKTNSALVMEGDTVRLSCRTSMHWFFCLWNSPQYEQSCAIQLGQPQSVCSASNKSVLIGTSHSCDLQIQAVTRADHGLWMCLINDNKNFDSVKQFVSVDVGVIPDTGVSIEAGNLWDADTETRVEVVEGDNIALSCYARHGFPPSLVSWEHDITNDTSLRVEPVSYQQLTGSHLVTVKRTIIYTASLSDHNNSISCRVTQKYLQSDRVIYARNMRVSLMVKERQFPAPLVREMTVISGVVVASTLALLFCLVSVLLIVRFSKKRRRRSSPDVMEMPLMYRTPLVSQQYSCGDVFTQISDYSKPMAHTCSSNFVDTCDDSETRGLDTWSTRQPSGNHTMTSSKSQRSNTVTSNGLESRLESRLESHSYTYRSPTVTRHSASSSDCASLSQYSHEADADLVERLQTPLQEVTLTDNPFNPLDSLHHGSHGDSLQHQDHSLSVCTSVPHLSRRRSSIPARILVNPTQYPAVSLTNLRACNTPLPRTEGSSHHHHTECRVPGSKRKRRKTAPAKSRSIHSVFDCDQGCFDTEELDRSQQFVFITTGPMVI